MHIVAWWLFFRVSVKYYSHNNGLSDKYRGLLKDHPKNLGNS